MSDDKQIDIAGITLKFTSSTGDCSHEMEVALEELERVIDYHAQKMCEQFKGLHFQRESD